jgi:hypothetical protein
MSVRAWVLAFAILTTAGAVHADDSDLGGPGESCRARSDCKHGLKCLANVCADEHEGESCQATPECGTLKCIANKCVNPLAQTQPPKPPPQQPTPQPTQPVTQPTPTPTEPVVVVPAPDLARPPSHAFDEWLHFRRTGVHPFIGVTLGVGFVNGGYTGSEGSLWGSGADGAALIALRGGVTLDNRHELALEIAPFTYFWDLAIGPGPAFEVNASYAYHLMLLQKPMAQITWPLRIGAGFVAGGTNTNSNAFFEARLDVIGVALSIGHATIELHAPSFRYALTNGHVEGIAVEGVTTHWLTFIFGTSVSYAF